MCRLHTTRASAPLCDEVSRLGRKKERMTAKAGELVLERTTSVGIGWKVRLLELGLVGNETALVKVLGRHKQLVARGWTRAEPGVNRLLHSCRGDGEKIHFKTLVDSKLDGMNSLALAIEGM